MPFLFFSPPPPLDSSLKSCPIALLLNNFQRLLFVLTTPLLIPAVQDADGSVEYKPKIVTFSSVHDLTLHVPANFGAEKTKVKHLHTKICIWTIMLFLVCWEQIFWGTHIFCFHFFIEKFNKICKGIQVSISSKAVLWIRIQIESLLRNFVDPDTHR